MKTQKELRQFYQKVDESGIPELCKTVQTYRNWEREILNRFEFNYSHGFVEGLKLLHHQYKNIGRSVG